MLEAFVITLREGLEAFLIVALSLAFLRKTARHELVRAVYAGIVIALGLSALGGYLLFNASNQEWLEGPLAIVAAVSVTFLMVHMWRAGRRMKGEIEGKLGKSTARAGLGAFLGVFLFTVLMITREGMETTLLLLQLRETLHLVLGASLGLVGAAGLAMLWTRYGKRVNLALFFQATAIFLFVFVVQLLIGGVHEMSEQGFLPFSEAIHTATEPWGPESAFGHTLTYAMLVLPMLWLAGASWFGSGRKGSASSAMPAVGRG
jgi:high-affinity iron transporter